MFRSMQGRIGYRCEPPEDPVLVFMANILSTLFWTLQFYFFYHRGPGMIVSLF